MIFFLVAHEVRDFISKGDTATWHARFRGLLVRANVKHSILKWSLVNRVFQDFQFRQMKKVKVFEPAKDFPRERSNLLTISNKFGLTFAGSDQTFKVYRTGDILRADKSDGNSNETGVDVVVTRHVALTSCMHCLAP